MSSTPIFFLEKKRAGGWSASNSLIRAATQTTDRKQVPQLGNDFHRNVSTFGRQTLMDTGRFLYENCSPVRAAVDEMARYSVSTFVSQFAGKNEAWGELAEAWIKEHDNIVDLAGWNFPMAVYRETLVKSVLRDGDFGTLLVKNEKGYPFFQTVASHRIRTPRTDDGLVPDGDYKGEAMIDGVICNRYGAPIAYRICGENKYDEKVFTDVPERDFILSYVPNYSGQVRGISSVATAAFDFSDANESRAAELLAQKMAAVMTFVEENPLGAPMESSAMVSQGTLADGSDIEETATGRVFEKFDAGQKQYFRSNQGSKITAITADRPSANQQAFEDKIIRSALNSMGWSHDLLDPTKAGGAQMRVVVAKINRTCAALRSRLVERAMRRIDGWRVSCAIQLGLLPQETEWFKWVYQGPEEVTADEGHSTDAAIKEINSGLSDYQTECAKRGEFWEEVMDRKIAYRKRLNEKCKEAGVDPGDVILLTPNGNPTATNPAKEEPTL